MPHFRPLMLLANRLSSIQSILSFERWEGYHHFEDEKVSDANANLLCPMMCASLSLTHLFDFVSILYPGYRSSCNTLHVPGHEPWCQCCPISPIQARAAGSNCHSSYRNYFFFDDNTVSATLFLVNRVQYTPTSTSMDSIFDIFVSLSSGRILLYLHLQPIGDNLGLFHD